MRIRIKTQVDENYKTVFKKFDHALFMALKPPLISLDLHKFEGCHQGDKVEMTLQLLGVAQSWKALIVEHEETADYIYFIDEGVEIPTPLKSWRHKHMLENVGEEKTNIIDDIHYTAGNKLMDTLLYPILYMQFWYRKPVYRKYFAKS